jgi:hypothetical protein
MLNDTNGNGMVMPVSPMYGNGGFGGGFGGDWGWIILLLLIAGNGWGNGFGGFGGFGGLAADGAALYPWMNQAEITNDGFRDQMMNTTINGIQDRVTTGFGDVQNALCAGFAGVNATINNAQMADMNRSFALQSQFADCCCENRLATADLKYTVATENCADRQALNEGVRDIIANQTAGTQRILDQLCADKIDAKNDEIAQLRQELLYARGQASQIAQNSTIIDGIYNRLDSCPVGTTPVYGRTPIFSCNGGCGCNGNTFYN